MFNDQYTPEEHSVAMEVANRLLHADYLLIDTRSAHEYAGCRVIGSISCPSPASFADFTKPNFSLSDVGLCMNASDHTYLMGDYHRPGQKILIGVNYHREGGHDEQQNHQRTTSSSTSSASHRISGNRPSSSMSSGVSGFQSTGNAFKGGNMGNMKPLDRYDYRNCITEHIPTYLTTLLGNLHLLGIRPSSTVLHLSIPSFLCCNVID